MHIKQICDYGRTRSAKFIKILKRLYRQLRYASHIFVASISLHVMSSALSGTPITTREPAGLDKAALIAAAAALDKEVATDDPTDFEDESEADSDSDCF